MLIQPLALALALIVLNVVIVFPIVLAGFHPGPLAIVLNVLALVTVFFLLASGRIRFRD